MQHVDGVFEGVGVILDGLGYRTVEDVTSQKAFGSRYADFETAQSARRLRLIWDAKDSWFILQSGESEGWRDLDVKRTGRVFEVAAVVAAIRRTIELHMKGDTW